MTTVLGGKDAIEIRALTNAIKTTKLIEAEIQYFKEIRRISNRRVKELMEVSHANH